MVVAVVSGKGGTGKTLFSTALTLLTEDPVVILDCDVEEPNAEVFINCPSIESVDITIDIPFVDEKKCSGCGLCANFCKFKAIAVTNDKARIFTELCHSCSGCSLICRENAIVEKDYHIGIIRSGTRENVEIVSGILDIGYAMSPPLINQVKEYIVNDRFVIIDSPPGISCPMIAAVNNVDYVIVVAEPTVFGFNDFKLIIRALNQLNLPFGVVINKDGLGDNKIADYCSENNYRILMRIPNDLMIASSYSEGINLLTIDNNYTTMFKKLNKFLKKEIKSKCEKR